MDQDRFKEVLLFATHAHHRQCRKGGKVPYVAHVLEVAEALCYHYPDDLPLTLAGLLHDVIEDTAYGEGELQERFGEEITGLVMAVTKPEDENLSHNDKRRATLAQLTPDKPRVLRLKSADALSNLHAIRRDLMVSGEETWKKFKASKEENLQYYSDILKLVQAGIEGEPIVRELERELKAVQELTL